MALPARTPPDPTRRLAVRVELRHGRARPVVYEMAGDEFLVGSVPGCDLRLPGTGLPPVICALNRTPDGVRLRRLSPALALELNGAPVPPGGSAVLHDGDAVRVGPVELGIAVESAGPVLRAVPAPPPGRDRGRAELEEARRLRGELEQIRDRLYDEIRRRRADLDRRERELDEREADGEQYRQRAAEADGRLELLRGESERLEESARHIDEEQERLRAEAERIAARDAEQAAEESRRAERAAQLEGQQAAVAAMRTRLERRAEELREEAARLAEQRARQDEAARELQAKAESAEQARLAAEQQARGRTHEQESFDERSRRLAEATTRLNESQVKLDADQQALADAKEALDRQATEQAEQSALLRSRAQQVRQLQERADADRQALQEREQALQEAETAQQRLQEQLRRRREELDARAAALDQSRQLAEAGHAELDELRAAAERERHEAAAQVEALRQELDQREAAAGQKEADLARREERLRDLGKAAAAEKKAAADGRETEQAALAAAGEQVMAEVRRLHEEFPQLDERCRAALAAVEQARERIGGHLGEAHEFARQGEAELRRLRGQVEAEAEAARKERESLARDRAEHRRAVTDFRRQLIDWQARINEMRDALAHSESHVAERQAALDLAQKHVAESQQELAARQEQVRAQEREAEQMHGDALRHLDDMRDWYRRKLRELVESRPGGPQALPEGDGPDPGDRRLGETLASLGLVEGETLDGLWAEARRQHKTLRQVLLASGSVTLYQLALIEAGNLAALALGPLRVIDRVRVSPYETTYRVFDPRVPAGADVPRGPAALRHFAEAEMDDAVKPDEYRGRFAAAAAVAHEHVAATFEVLDVQGRPAVLQEWLAGVPSSDWPPAAAQPGAWHRLVTSLAAAVGAAHRAGVAHGQIRPESVVLTPAGVLKLTGLGDPPWLRHHPRFGEPIDGLPPEPTPEADLRAVGEVALGWALLAPRRRGSKAKLLPDPLADVLRRLGAPIDGDRPAGVEPFTETAELIDALEAAGAKLPSHVDAWAKLTAHVEEHATDGAFTRRQAA